MRRVLRLAELAPELGPQAGRSLVIADGAVVASGYVARVVDALDVAVELHVVPAQEPTVQSVDAAADVARTFDAELVVGVGGGSALDTAKLAASVSAGDRSVARYALGAEPLPTGPPVVAVPTTAGTGAEATRTCVVTSDDGAKWWAWGEELLPPIVVLDPAATATMPPVVTTATGLDAFVHAMEAATGGRAGEAAAEAALDALRLVAEHLPAAVANGADLTARDGMQRAAFLAGVAIDAGGTGIAHAIGHALGSLAHVPHGLAVAAGLAAALDWNVSGTPAAYEPVADALRRPVDELAAWCATLFVRSGFDAAVARIGPLGVDAAALAAAMGEPANQPMLQNNCRLASEDDREVLAAATLDLWNERAS